MKVYLGADHAGYAVKEQLKQLLDKKKVVYEDVGTHTTTAADYPDYAKTVAQHVATEHDSRGILICGTGTGMAIAANKIKGIRAVVAYDTSSAILSRQHNNANILCLGGRILSPETIEQIVSVWLDTPFSGDERHVQRLKKITALEHGA